VGFVTQIKPSTFEQKTGFYASTIALATHQGGQIDSTNLPVTTLINLGATVGNKFSLPVGNAIAGIEIRAIYRRINPHRPIPSIRMEPLFTQNF
jgi:hypothetical protein